jgi:hypothetical protein
VLGGFDDPVRRAHPGLRHGGKAGRGEREHRAIGMSASPAHRPRGGHGERAAAAAPDHAPQMCRNPDHVLIICPLIHIGVRL